MCELEKRAQKDQKYSIKNAENAKHVKTKQTNKKTHSAMEYHVTSDSKHTSMPICG